MAPKPLSAAAAFFWLLACDWMPKSFWTKLLVLVLVDKVPLRNVDSWEHATTMRSRTRWAGLRSAKSASCSRSADTYSTNGMTTALHEHEEDMGSGGAAQRQASADCTRPSRHSARSTNTALR
jgi:hypothetical protein